MWESSVWLLMVLLDRYFLLKPAFFSYCIFWVGLWTKTLNAVCHYDGYCKMLLWKNLPFECLCRIAGSFWNRIPISSWCLSSIVQHTSAIQFQKETLVLHLLLKLWFDFLERKIRSLIVCIDDDEYLMGQELTRHDHRQHWNFWTWILILKIVRKKLISSFT